MDDDDLVLSATVSLIRSLGLEVVPYRSAMDFLDAQPSGLGCIVSDLHMPGMSGLELLETLRLRGSSTPFILITAYPSQRVRERAAEGGILCLLEKPGAPDDLVACLTSVFGLLH